MKKIITSILAALAIVSVNATNYYVDGSKADDSGDGKSWATAKKTITAAGSASSVGDSIFVKTGVYTFSNATSGGSCLAATTDRNYLGGFIGTESSSDQRAKSDIDNNGTIDPWEFSNATILSFNATNNAYGLYINSNTAKRVFDGFTISGTLDVGQLSSSAGGNNMVKINNFTLFRNNTLSSCTLSAAPNTATANAGYTKGALLFMAQPTATTGGSNIVDNCLIENNISTVTPTSAQTQDVQQSPFVHIDASNTSGRNVMSNCVFRKNQITLDFTSFGMATPSYNNPRGMLISMSIYGSASLIGQYNCIKNLLVYNNSASFTPKAGASVTTNLGNGGLLYAYNTAQNTYDSILNCTVVNNAMMRIGYAIRGGFSNTTQPYHIFANNVLMENKNDNGSGTISVQNLIINQIPATTGTGILIANNIMNGGSGYTVVANTVVNNLNDLSATNTNATKGAWFTLPSTVSGYSTDASVATSKWTIGAGSYLIGKGIVTANKTDKAGVAFSLTTPAVGAYEYVNNLSTGVFNPVNLSFVSVVNNGILCNENGTVQIVSFVGQTIYSKSVEAGSRITLASGAYIVRLISDKGISVRKILI